MSITEIETGIAYDSYTVKEDFDPNLASAYNLEVVKAKLKAIEALNINDDIDDITITLKNQIHIINISLSRAYFIYLAVDSNAANLGITKSLLNKYKLSLNEAI